MKKSRRRSSDRLLERMSRLAKEKSNLQLVADLMCSLGAIAGLDNIVDRILQLLLDTVGGNDMAIYYRAEGKLLYADVFGAKSELRAIADGMVRRAFETGEAVEETHSFRETGMLTREFTHASSLALPLRIRDELIGVIKMDGMLMDSAQLRRDMHPFFEYAALLLKHELESSSRLHDAFDQLSVAHQALREEMRVRQSQQGFLAAVLDTIDAGIVACDAEGRLTLFNRKACELFGENPGSPDLETWAARTVLCQIDGHTRLTLEERPLYRALHGERLEHAELMLPRTGAPPRSLLASGQPIHDAAGRTIGAVVALQDVTEQQHLEVQLRLAQKLEAVGQLAAGIAHEINTPTQFVGDNLLFLSESFHALQDLLERYRKGVREMQDLPAAAGLAREIAQAEDELEIAMVEDNVSAAFADAAEGVSRIKSIVTAMRDFAHPAKRQKSPCDINRALANTLTIARNEYKYVADVMRDMGDLPPVNAFVNDLNQVFLNLFINAAHAIEDRVRGTRQRGIIKVTTRLAGERVRIEISDTGSGIPEHVRSRIFEPFFTTKEVGRGSGQGLAIARSIVVERHGGTLDFVSEAGKGTTFVIELPINGVATAPPLAVIEDQPEGDGAAESAGGDPAERLAA